MECVLGINLLYMKMHSNIPATFDDVVFENRNKLYGAYALRSSYNATLVKALSLSALILGGILFAGTRQWAEKQIVAPIFGETIIEDYFPPAEEEKEVVQPKPDEPQQQPEQQTTTNPVQTTTPDQFSPEGTTEPQIKPKSPIITNFAQTGTITPAAIPLPAGPGGESGTVGTSATTGNTGNGSTEKPVNFAEFNPEFPGGEAAMNKFIIKYLQKDDQWRDMGLSGKVYVQFVVDKDGNVTDVKAVTGTYEGLKKVSERAIKAMPKWKPGRNGDHIVPVILTIPINFIIN